ncbi:hypothetical protein ACFTAO_24570 [Paenibacillus rhizoplanae]
MNKENGSAGKAVLEADWLYQHTYEGNEGYELLKKRRAVLSRPVLQTEHHLLAAGPGDPDA